ncbi:winged helix-turn-helix domain-containing protein [Streptomyces sp. NPDC006733]|uniref:ArsR/SmtB family transcription factor n=1 Tax=Streptomyces sp. NPDC006733 TaxID=3155460 RepID=UPI0033FB68AE
MLRIHFTGEDLGRVRVAAGPAPMWETVLSLHRIQRGEDGVLLRQWRRSVRPALPRSVGMLTSLVPRQGYFPDFLTPAGAPLELAEGVEGLLSSPRTVLRRDMNALAAERKVPPWAREVGDGSVGMLRHLVRALHAYHQVAVAPFRDLIRAQIDADRAVRARALLDGGTDALLAGMPPSIRWKAPVLEVDYPVPQELRLHGRGLLLIPSFFCWRTGVTLLHDAHTPVLVYPVRHRLPAVGDPGRSGRPLAALLGQTRAAVLEAAHTPRTIAELARHVGVSLSAASQHVAVLRDAGLLVSTRLGGGVLHRRTPLGSALLQGQTLTGFPSSP